MSLELVTPSSDAAEQPTALYRAFDASGVLLYVGISTNALVRFYQHQIDKDWWGEVHRLDLEHFMSREAAVDAERAAIAGENPRYNVAPGRRVTSKSRPTWQEERDRMLETHWEPNRSVVCLNCGHAPSWLPKRALIVEVDCPQCECPTLEREGAT